MAQYVQIVYDEASGGMNVQAPPNLVLALGILEAAKVALIQKATQPKPLVEAVPAAVLGGPAGNGH